MFPHATEVGLVHRLCFGQQNVDGSDGVPDLSLSVRWQLMFPLMHHVPEVSMSHLVHGSMEKERHVKRS